MKERGMELADLFVSIRGKPGTTRALGFNADTVIVTIGRKSGEPTNLKDVFKESKSPLTDLSQTRTFTLKAADVCFQCF